MQTTGDARHPRTPIFTFAVEQDTLTFDTGGGGSQAYVPVNMVDLIKAVRTYTGCGLKEAKDLCEEFVGELDIVQDRIAQEAVSNREVDELVSNVLIPFIQNMTPAQTQRLFKQLGDLVDGFRDRG